MKITTEELSSFPENCNPYHHDLYHMGTPFGKNLLIMHANHPSEECNYLILVNTKTGKRVKVNIEEE